MTDLETLQAMFDRADVRYKAKDRADAAHVLETPGEDGFALGGAGNLGYPGFFTEFGFDAEGRLLWVGAWE